MVCACKKGWEKEAGGSLKASLQTSSGVTADLDPPASGFGPGGPNPGGSKSARTPVIIAQLIW